jgi:regulatory protein
VKITELSPQKNNPSRFNLFVDEQFFLGVSATGVAKYNLYKGKDINQESLDEIVVQEIYQRFLDRTVEYLSRTVKTERDVRRYLKQLQFKKKGKWFEDTLALDWDALYERVVEQLKKYKYIDDQRFSQLFIESRAKSKPRSTSIMISELVAKGVDRKTAQEVVSGSDISNEDLLLKVYTKRFKDQELDLTDRKKVDFLRRKGFNWDEISKLADRLKDDTSE